MSDIRVIGCSSCVFCEKSVLGYFCGDTCQIICQDKEDLPCDKPDFCRL